MTGDRLAFFLADRDIGQFDDIEADRVEALADIALGMGETLVRTDHEGAAGKGFRRQGFAGEDEQAAGIHVFGGTEKQGFERAEIGQHVGRGDEVEGLVVIVFEEIDDFGHVERLINVLFVGDLDHVFRQVDTGDIVGHVAQRAAGQASCRSQDRARGRRDRA